ncbi:MAG TPA: hypothetical protein EYQ44_00825 [Porticoccaceae bacterium]|nr:hypothetical protein [Porticoccaceae bacterium]HIG66369.1 hypothetical protein [Porticoccaceae bacterium]HIK79383.1 hypothetical protein [Porticoccaceae bacterium]
MNKTLLSISILLLAQFSFAAHHEAGETAGKTIIGHEISDDGVRLNIHAGDLATVEIWVNYVQAHNDRDLEAINNANAADFKGWAPNGVVVDGPAAHAAFLKEWFATSNPTWEYKYGIANDVTEEDGSIQQWVTSGVKVTDTAGGEEVISHQIFDARIENGKVKMLLVYARPDTAEE